MPDQVTACRHCGAPEDATAHDWCCRPRMVDETAREAREDAGLPFNAVFDNQPQPRQWRIPYPPEPTDVAAVAPVDAPERIFRRHVDPMVGPTWRDQFGAETTWEILLADYIQGVREVPGV